MSGKRPLCQGPSISSEDEGGRFELLSNVLTPPSRKRPPHPTAQKGKERATTGGLVEPSGRTYKRRAQSTIGDAELRRRKLLDGAIEQVAPSDPCAAVAFAASSHLHPCVSKDTSAIASLEPSAAVAIAATVSEESEPASLPTLLNLVEPPEPPVGIIQRPSSEPAVQTPQRQNPTVAEHGASGFLESTEIAASESPEELLNRLIRTLPSPQRKAWLSNHIQVIQKQAVHTERNREEKVARRRARKVAAKQVEKDKCLQSEVDDLKKREVAAQLDVTIRELLEKKNRLLGRTCSENGGPFTPSQGSPTTGFKQGRAQLSLPSSSSCTAGGSEVGPTQSEELSLGTWEQVLNAPPCTTNNKAQPIGPFWDHLRQYACDRAFKTFRCHIDWNRQCPALKTRFKLRLRELYPGSWDDSYVMRYIGNNLKERRARIRDKLRNTNRKDKVVVPIGCTTESLNAIFESLSDPKKQSKSHKCRTAAVERYKDGGVAHRYGRVGISGLVSKFEDEFGRAPTAEEVEFAKFKGYLGLAERTRVRLSESSSCGGIIIYEGESSKTKSREKKQPISTCKAKRSTRALGEGKHTPVFEEDLLSTSESETDPSSGKEHDGSGSSSGYSSRDESDMERHRPIEIRKSKSKSERFKKAQ